MLSTQNRSVRYSSSFNKPSKSSNENKSERSDSFTNQSRPPTNQSFDNKLRNTGTFANKAILVNETDPTIDMMITNKKENERPSLLRTTFNNTSSSKKPQTRIRVGQSTNTSKQKPKDLDFITFC